MQKEIFLKEIAGAAKEERNVVGPSMCDFVNVRLHVLAESKC
jgi:hypothetical protein